MIPSFRCTAFSEAFIKFCSATTVMLIAASGASARVLVFNALFEKTKSSKSRVRKIAPFGRDSAVDCAE